MTEKPETGANPGEDQTTCPHCGGSGQLGGFRGESRFVISWDECFFCNGTGYVTDETNPEYNNNRDS